MVLFWQVLMWAFILVCLGAVGVFALAALEDMGAIKIQRNIKKSPFVVGQMYWIKHESEGVIEAVYMGMTLDGFRHFNNLETGMGMKYKVNDPEILLKDRDIIRMNVQPEVRK